MKIKILRVLKWMLEKDNSDGDIDAYCYEYDNVNNHHMAYDVDNMVKDYGQG